MQNLGLTNKEHYDMLWYFLEWSITFLSPLVITIKTWTSNWASIATSFNVPGHINTLHSLVSKEGPRVEQSTPPLASLGKEHFRVLSCVPPPQLAEQTDQ